MRRLKLIFMVAALLAIAWLVHKYLPAQHNPLRRADLTAPIGLATYGQLSALKHDGALCQARLDAAGVEFVVVAADEPGGNCTLGETVTLTRSLTPYNAAPLRMTCHQLATLYIWERRVARPLAQKTFGSPLARIETFGTYSCRNIAGTRVRSQHAAANAIDISGFVLEDGRRISVREHWRGRDDNGKYLAKVHKGACRLFSVTLGPDYNAAHGDHFHLDMGSTESCK